MYSKRLILFLFMAFAFQLVHAQYNYSLLKKADSLFYIQKHAQAFEIYQQLDLSEQQYSPQMLLKMAYIKEVENDFTSSLYYLNQYYHFQPEKKVLKKMEELAAKYKLEGYRYTDLEYFISIYNQYYYYLIFLLLLIVLLFYFYIIFKRIFKRRMGLRPLLFIATLGIAYYLTNYNIIPVQAIIKNSNSYLMSAPSAGADFISFVGQGHRVRLLDKNDIWYKISWKNKTGYIREGNLLIIGEGK